MENATPTDLPAWSLMSIVEASPHDSATAYVAANRYKLDDFRPYIFKTTNFGRSWTKIVKGIPEDQFAHVVREDPNRKGLLYAGTERGIYVSFDQGENWQPLQQNLPVTPVHDLAIQAREKDLVAATHGRSFWILDDLTPLYQMNDEIARSEVHLFLPRETYRMGGFSFDRPGLALGKNPPNGAVVQYYFRHKPAEKDSVKMEFLDEKGTLIRTFTHREEKKEPADAQPGPPQDEGPNVPADSGMNRFVWDMRYADAVKVPGGILWGGSLQGPVAVPGKYQVRLKLGPRSWTQSFEIRKDPRLPTPMEEFKEQFDFLMKIRDKISAAHDAVNIIRDIRKQTEDLVKRLEKHPSKKVVADSAKRINDRLRSVEEALIQVKIKSGQDALNYPIRLNDKLVSLSSVVGSADARPTKQSYDVFNELSAQVDEQLAKYKRLLETDLTAFDKVVKNLDIPAIIVKPAESQARPVQN